MECSSILIQRKCECGNTHIQTANLCRDRLCPICNWRLSLKRYANMMHILSFIKNNTDEELRYMFMTLTIRNCAPTRLNDTIKHMSASWNRLLQRKFWKQRIKGFARSVEVTFNPLREDFHPHFHILLALNPNEVITSEQVQEDWKGVLRISYNPITDIREVYNRAGEEDNTAAVLETFKYAIKSRDAENMPLNLFRAIAEQMNSLRLVSFGGIFKDVKNLLALEMDTISEEDEISIRKDECNQCGKLMQEVLYKWSFGEHAYKQFDPNTEPAETIPSDQEILREGIEELLEGQILFTDED